MIGSTLASRYQVLEVVGEGGMAVTYRARDGLLNRDVAVKVLRDQFLTNDEFVERFNREAQSAASLSHSNISTVYDIGHQDGMRFIVMEYVHGSNLEQYVREIGPLPIDVAIEIARQVCSALAHAHEKGIVHRDIKPSNILLSDGWRNTNDGDPNATNRSRMDGRNFVKVTDFGIARALAADSITADQSVLGTANYLSPEQARGEAAGPASDLYSLGAVLYYMLTGKVPFTGDSPVAIAVKHIHERPVPPSRLRPDVSVELNSIVMKALEKDPESRYASAPNMLHDLRAVELGAPGRFASSQARPFDFAQTKPFDSRQAASVSGIGLDPTVDDGDRTQVLPGASISAAASAKNDQWRDHTAVFQPPPSAVVDSRPVQRPVSRRKWLPTILAACVALAIVSGAIGIYVAAPTFIGTDGSTVPDVERMELNEARRAIQEAGLRTGTIEFRANSEIPSNYVIRQMPPAGQRVKEDAKIDLVVSKGDEVEFTEVPDLSEMSQKRAAQLLEQAGLKLGNASEEENDTVPKGILIRQSLAPGTRIQRGATIDVVVSTGAPEPTPPATPKITRGVVEYEVPDGPEEQHIKIVLHDDEGEHIVYEKMHAPGDKVSVNIAGKGKCQARVFNGETLEDTSDFEPESEE